MKARKAKDCISYIHCKCFNFDYGLSAALQIRLHKVWKKSGSSSSYEHMVFLIWLLALLPIVGKTEVFSKSFILWGTFSLIFFPWLYNCVFFILIFSLFGCTGFYLWHVGSSSLTKNWTWASALRAHDLSHWTTREVPDLSFETRFHGPLTVFFLRLLINWFLFKFRLKKAYCLYSETKISTLAACCIKDDFFYK